METLILRVVNRIRIFTRLKFITSSPLLLGSITFNIHNLFRFDNLVSIEKAMVLITAGIILVAIFLLAYRGSSAAAAISAFLKNLMIPKSSDQKQVRESVAHEMYHFFLGSKGTSNQHINV